ncbi:MAG: hypothetical protein ACTSYB_11135, partial [Candidatus Helarchaeota archaeon]
NLGLREGDLILGLREGDLILIKADRHRIIITPEKISPFEKLANLLGEIQYNEKTEKEVENFLFQNHSRLL